MSRGAKNTEARRRGPLQVLRDLRPGDHALLLRPTDEAERAALVAFARGAVAAGQKVIIVVPQALFMLHVATLQQLASLVGPREFSGQFALLPEEEILAEAAALGGGGPTPFLQGLVQRALREGWRAVRFAHVSPAPRREAWEGAWREVARGGGAVVLCSYPPPAPGTTTPGEPHDPVVAPGRRFPARRRGP